VLAESSVGAIVTSGDPNSDRANTLGGLDFRYLNTRVRGNRVLEADGWFQRSDTEGLDGDDTAFGVGVRMPNNSGWRGGFGYKALGANFNPALGFVSRTNVRDTTADVGYTHFTGGRVLQTLFAGVDVEKQAQWGKPTGRNYVRPTQTDRAHIALNCYEPGVNDELHCHPGSDHTFFVVEGECTMKGLKDDEEFKLTKHQAVHVPAGFFYQLNNTGTGRLILYQVSTEPKPKPKIGKVIYGVHTGLKEHLLNPVD
jgi:mannose-6-phosphate isomerase-like protein (cupin superfamily)